MSEQYPGGFITKEPPTPDGPYETDSAYGIWNLSQQAAYQAQGLWPTAGSLPPDAQFNYVTMLLHGDGTNGAQNNTFTDSSTNNFTITRSGNPTQGSFSPYGSNWSNHFDGTGDELSTASGNTSLTFGTGAYTVEFWVYSNVSMTSYSSNQGPAFIYCDAINGWGIWSQNAASNYLKVATRSSGDVSLPSNYVLIANQWNHVVAVRSGTGSNQFAIFVNGTRVANSTDSYNWSVSGAVKVGGISTSGYYVNGSISNMRVVKGTAIYDPTAATLTVPTTPLTAVANTSLLTCQSNRFVDNSTNAYAITPAGNSSVQRFNPFGTSTAYSTATIGGSGYFDGTGDYLTVPNTSPLQVLGGSFTLDCWIYLTAAQANMGIIGIHDNSTAGYFIRLDTSIIRFYTSAATVDRTYAFAQNTWYHIAVVSSGTTGTLYINGVAQGATFSTNGTQDTTDQFIIGKTTTLTNYFTGYISDVRVIKGSAVVPPVGGPTAPLTAVTNTQLLCNFTNAAIYDNAMMNDLETVGNAQISTSVVKYGTGSLYFDGTGDYLLGPAVTSNAFGTGDFTIECWAYVSAYVGTYEVIACVGDYKTGGIAFYIDNGGGGTLKVYINDVNVTASAAGIAAGSWYHLAVTRSGTTVRLFINGVAGTSGSNSANITGSQVRVGVGYYSGAIDSGAFNGYIDDLRITNGYARYTTTFTPPTAAFPNIGPT